MNWSVFKSSSVQYSVEHERSLEVEKVRLMPRPQLVITPARLLNSTALSVVLAGFDQGLSLADTC